MSSSSSLSGARRRRAGGGSGPTPTSTSSPPPVPQRTASGLKSATPQPPQNNSNPFQLLQQHEAKLNMLRETYNKYCLKKMIIQIINKHLDQLIWRLFKKKLI